MVTRRPPARRRHFHNNESTGPVAIRGAKAGMTLEIRIKRIRTGRWGWSAGPGASAQLDPYLGLGAGPGGPPAVITVPRGDHAMFWDLDPEGAVRWSFRSIPI